jgi:hypothetical protein
MHIPKILTTLLLGASLQFAAPQGYISNLDAAQDGGGARTGSGQVLLYLTGSTLSISNGTYSGLSGNVSAAHIHGPANPGVNAGVLYGLNPTFITTGATAGNFLAGNLTLVDGTGGFTIAQQQAQLLAGQWYINIHTSTFPGGEIRGQITLVPEPASATLVLLGAGLLCCWRTKSAGPAV